MRAVIQRVKSSSVSVDGKIISQIKNGLNILIGFGQDDTEGLVKPFVEKIVNLRVMADEQGKMNKSILDVGGEILLVSQFTLYADCSGGRRPSFVKAAEPEQARRLYEKMKQEFAQCGVPAKEGSFGQYMSVSIENDGPVTIILDSCEK